MIIKLYTPQVIHEQGQRANQEDSIYPAYGEATAENCLYVLCDGMGGHDRGEVASSAICQGLSSFFQENANNGDILNDNQLRDAIEYAYQQLDAKDNGEFRKAGTTMTMLFFHRGGCTAAHIGDSRIYHVRPSNKTILYQSRDHSLVFELYQSGEISYDEMKTHPRKNQISKAMIPGKENRQKADIVHITDILPGDYFFICSDGMLETMENDELVNLLATNTDDAYKCQRLIEMTSNNADNHSAYLLHVNEVLVEDGDETLLNDEQTVKFNAVNIHPVFEATNKENDVKVIGSQKAEQTHVNVTPSKVKTSSRKWLPFLLGTVVVAAIIIVYAMMINPPQSDNNIKVDSPSISTSQPNDVLDPEIDSPKPSVPFKTIKNPVSPKQDLKARKVANEKGKLEEKSKITDLKKEVSKTLQESSKEDDKSADKKDSDVKKDAEKANKKSDIPKIRENKEEEKKQTPLDDSYEAA